MFKVGDKAILQITFGLVEKGRGYCFDAQSDMDSFVRGDVVEILRTIDNTTDATKDRHLAVIYNPKTYRSTTVSMRHLEPIKGEININVPVKINVDAKKITDALRTFNDAVKIHVGDPKKIAKGELGNDMKITGGTISAKDINIAGAHLHTGGMIHGDKKLSF